MATMSWRVLRPLRVGRLAGVAEGGAEAAAEATGLGIVEEVAVRRRPRY